MPIVRILSVIFIEFWRGVPLITVLFMSSVMLPLFMAEGTSIDKLIRALVGVILFQSAYVAEVVRGGLQALPKGQYEAAESLALGYWKTQGLVILPQALKLVIPGLVNTIIDARQFPTLAWGDPTLPSALRRFTSEFGMGSGGTTALRPPGKFCLSDRFCVLI